MFHMPELVRDFTYFTSAHISTSKSSRNLFFQVVDPVDGKEADLVLHTRSDVYWLMHGWGSPWRHDWQKNNHA